MRYYYNITPSSFSRSYNVYNNKNYTNIALNFSSFCHCYFSLPSITFPQNEIVSKRFYSSQNNHNKTKSKNDEHHFTFSHLDFSPEILDTDIYIFIHGTVMPGFTVLTPSFVPSYSFIPHRFLKDGKEQEFENLIKQFVKEQKQQQSEKQQQHEKDSQESWEKQNIKNESESNSEESEESSKLSWYKATISYLRENVKLLMEDQAMGPLGLSRTMECVSSSHVDEDVNITFLQDNPALEENDDNNNDNNNNNNEDDDREGNTGLKRITKLKQNQTKEKQFKNQSSIKYSDNQSIENNERVSSSNDNNRSEKSNLFESNSSFSSEENQNSNANNYHQYNDQHRNHGSYHVFKAHSYVWNQIHHAKTNISKHDDNNHQRDESDHRRRALYYTFGWSGLLDEGERFIASSQLYDELCDAVDSLRDEQRKAQLENNQKETPELKVHVIAHSHGGNVAMLLQHFEQERRRGLNIDNLVLFGTPLHPKLLSINHDSSRIVKLFASSLLNHEISKHNENLDHENKNSTLSEHSKNTREDKTQIPKDENDLSFDDIMSGTSPLPSKTPQYQKQIDYERNQDQTQPTAEMLSQYAKERPKRYQKAVFHRILNFHSNGDTIQSMDRSMDGLPYQRTFSGLAPSHWPQQPTSQPPKNTQPNDDTILFPKDASNNNNNNNNNDNYNDNNTIAPVVEMFDIRLVVNSNDSAFSHHGMWYLSRGTNVLSNLHPLPIAALEPMLTQPLTVAPMSKWFISPVTQKSNDIKHSYFNDPAFPVRQLDLVIEDRKPEKQKSNSKSKSKAKFTSRKKPGDQDESNNDEVEVKPGRIRFEYYPFPFHNYVARNMKIWGSGELNQLCRFLSSRTLKEWRPSDNALNPIINKKVLAVLPSPIMGLYSILKQTFSDKKDGSD